MTSFLVSIFVSRRPRTLMAINGYPDDGNRQARVRPICLRRALWRDPPHRGRSICDRENAADL